MNEDNHSRDNRTMGDEAVGDAVLEYLNDNPEIIRDLAPERDLWPGIESRITARIIPLERHEHQPAFQRKVQWKAWLPMAAAAAVLIAGSASITYVLTKRGDVAVQTSRAPQSIVAGPTVTASPMHAQNAHGQQAGYGVDTPPREVAAAPVAAAPGPLHDATHDPITSERARPGRSAASSTRLASLDDADADPDPRATYDTEITTLRSALDARRPQLDPATVKTIEQNLHIIDNAISQARAALAKDPRSRFLGSQLNRSLAKETDFLRAAALLPST